MESVNSETSEGPPETMEYTDVDVMILDKLRGGRVTQGYLVDSTGHPRHTIHDRLWVLTVAGDLKKVHEPTALYELADEDRSADAPYGPVDPSDVREAILHLMQRGRVTQGYLVDATGIPRHTIRKDLRRLSLSGDITKVHEPTALYELENDSEEGLEG